MSRTKTGKRKRSRSLGSVSNGGKPKNKAESSKIILVASSVGGAGCSSFALNSAALLALSDFKVLFVDLSFGENQLTKELTKTKRAQHKLKDYLTPGKSIHLADLPLESEFINLSYIETGIDFITTDPKSAKLKKNLVKELSKLKFDYTVIDLGRASDRMLLDYFVSKGISILIADHTRGYHSIGNFSKHILARKLDNLTRRYPTLKDLILKLELSSLDKDRSITDLVTDLTTHKESVEDALKQINKNPLYHIVSNKVSSSRENLDQLSSFISGTNLNIDNAGFLPYEKNLGYEGYKPFPFITFYPDSDYSLSLRSLLSRLLSVDLSFDESSSRYIKEGSLGKFADRVTELQTKLETHHNEKKAQLEKRFETEKLSLEEEQRRELDNLKKVRLRELDIELKLEADELHSRMVVEVLSDVSKIKEKKLREIEADLLSESVSLKDEMVSRLQKEEKLSRQNFESDLARLKATTESNIKSKESELLNELESNIRKRENERLNLLDEKIKSLEDEKIKDLQARYRKDISHVKETIWKELDEDRKRKIESIDDEVNRIRLKEISNLSYEMEEHRSNLTRKAEQAADSLHRSIVNEFFKDVMEHSAKYDVECYKKDQEIRKKLSVEYEHQLSRQQEKIFSELDEYRKKRLEEISLFLSREEIQKKHLLEESLRDWNNERIQKINARLRSLVYEKSQTISKTIAGKIEKKFETVRQQVKSDLLKARVDIAKEKESRLALLKLRINDYDKQKKIEIDNHIESIKKERLIDLEKDILNIRVKKEKELELFISDNRSKQVHLLEKAIEIRKDHMQKTLSGELEQLRISRISDLDEELRIYKDRSIKSFDDQLRLRRIDREQMIDLDIQSELKLRREALVNALDNEKFNLREKMLKDLESEMSLTRDSVKRSLLPFKQSLEKMLDEEVKARREFLMQRVENEYDEIRENEVRAINKRLKNKIAAIINKANDTIDEEKQSLIKSMVSKLEQLKEEYRIDNIIELEFERFENLSCLQDELETERSKRISEMEAELTARRRKLEEKLSSDIDDKRKADTILLLNDMKEEKSRLLAIINGEIRKKKKSLMHDFISFLKSKKEIKLKELSHEAKINEKAMLIALEKRKQYLLEKSGSWVAFETEKLRMNLKEQLNADLLLEREKKIAAIDEEVGKIKSDLMKRTKAEVSIERSRMERESEDLYMKQPPSYSLKFDKDIEQLKINKIKLINDELMKEKHERLEIIEGELAIEKEKRLGIMEAELKAEEYKRRQAMIADIMKKKYELDTALSQEKNRFYEEIKQELIEKANLNKDLFDRELKRLGDNLRIN